jgi:hypothetical protein
MTDVGRMAEGGVALARFGDREAKCKAGRREQTEAFVHFKIHRTILGCLLNLKISVMAEY